MNRNRSSGESNDRSSDQFSDRSSDKFNGLSSDQFSYKPSCQSSDESITTVVRNTSKKERDEGATEYQHYMRFVIAFIVLSFFYLTLSKPESL